MSIDLTDPAALEEAAETVTLELQRPYFAGAEEQRRRTLLQLLAALARAEAERLRAPQLREQVAGFAGWMEARLRRHDEKRGERGWIDADVYWLLTRLRDEVRELEQAVGRHFDPDYSGVDVANEAADVANFAMMIVDRCDCLPRTAERLRAPAPDVEAIRMKLDSVRAKMIETSLNRYEPDVDAWLIDLSDMHDMIRALAGTP